MRMVSRTKVENMLSLVLNGINLSLYALVIVACIYKAIQTDFSQIVLCIYGGLIAALLVVNEIKTFEISLYYFRFLSVYRGRGMIFIFFGCLVLDENVLGITAGTLTFAMGLIYMIMSFIPTAFPPPNAIVINWQNWKDFSAEGLDLARPKHMSIESSIAIRLKSPPPPTPAAVMVDLGRQSSMLQHTTPSVPPIRTDMGLRTSIDNSRSPTHLHHTASPR
ncbi:COPI associated protein-domain-containing protein [Syncephalastrum racemosum]|uniref:COPI associated protein-domain-containing protein n=1 Tax=Syncephalastrum racemosum TaxID=13706 RepID=A0A1X2H5Y4_SYNRA|nr:COPI associated protein-domain-containing protein [Syncephalastrum racemosum]